MITIGLDLSLCSTGWAACFDPRGLPVFGTILTGKRTGVRRLDYLEAQIMECALGADEILEHPLRTLVVVEGPSFSSRSRAVYEIGWLHWQVARICHRFGLRLIVVPPVQLKIFATGSAHADKSIIVRAVSRRWGSEVANDDEADAVTLAMLGQAYLGADLPLTKKQEELIGRIRKKYPIQEEITGA